MAEPQSPSRGVSPAVLPQKRVLEEHHTPAISSPLNPNAFLSNDAPNSASRASKSSRPPAREQREKRDSLKKREASGTGTRGGTPDAHHGGAPSGKKSTPNGSAPGGLPLRFTLTEKIKPADWGPSKDPHLTSHEPTPLYTPDGEIELKKPQDHAENRRSYRYTYAVADPQFPHSQYFRASETRPFGPRMSFEDSDKSFWFDSEGQVLCNEKGWRMARANVVAREGRLYYEVKILRGVPGTGSAVPPGADGPLPHIRMGWARREASLDAPVGFDGYSYGVTDIRFEPMHRSRPSKFFRPPSKRPGKGAKAKKPTLITHTETEAHVREGDVIGVEIDLPPLDLHQKIVNGTYNPDVDTRDKSEELSTHLKETHDILRDRVAVHYKGNCYFEQIEYAATKPMESYNDRTQFTSAAATTTAKVPAGTSDPQTPHPQHAEPALCTLPDSSIRIYRNGRLVGTAFENLIAFLPPASAPSTATGVKTRTGLDDGMLGYFPAIAAFSGGVAQVNLGPRFWCPPRGSGLRYMDNGARGDTAMGNTEEEDVENALPADEEVVRGIPLTPISVRYAEQIAEDIVWDIVDEVSFFMEDGAYDSAVEKQRARSAASAPVPASDIRSDEMVDD